MHSVAFRCIVSVVAMAMTTSTQPNPTSSPPGNYGQIPTFHKILRALWYMARWMASKSFHQTLLVTSDILVVLRVWADDITCLVIVLSDLLVNQYPYTINNYWESYWPALFGLLCKYWQHPFTVILGNYSATAIPMDSSSNATVAPTTGPKICGVQCALSMKVFWSSLFVFQNIL